MSIESMVKALSAPNLSPSEKLLLLGIANHDGDGGAWPSIATLAGYVGVQVRQVQKLISALEDKGLVTRDLNGGGNAKTRSDQRPNLFHLHLDGVSSSAPRGVSPTTPETSTETTSTSSLRSDGDDREESGTDDVPRGDAVPAAQPGGSAAAKAYWESFVAANDGLRPSTPFIQLASVARKALRTGLSEDEVVAGMLATRVMTGEAVVKEAIRIRRERENAPATGVIEPGAMALFKAWAQWRHSPPTQHERGELLSTLSIMLRWPTMSSVEVGARLGGFARAHSSLAVPTLEDLKCVPLESRPLKPDDVDLVLVFAKYANGPRLEG